MQVPARRILLLVALVVATACGGDGSDGGAPEERAAATTASGEPSSTSSTATSSTTTTAPPPDPTVIPDDPAAIDEAYVEAVLQEHNRVIGDALRLQLEGADLKEIVDRYNAIYVPEVADLLLTDAISEDEATLNEYKQPPGDAKTSVTSIADVTEDCVVAIVEQDTSAFLHGARRSFAAQVVLRRQQAPPEVAALNNTPWQSEGLEPSSEDGERRCDEG